MFERFIIYLFEISLFGVLHCIDYSKFISSLRVAPKSKDIYEKLLFAIFVYRCHRNAD